MIATMSNETQFYLGPIPGMVPQIEAGKVRAIAITGDRRSPSLPDVPTFEEAGMAGLVLDQWLGVFVPAGTPPAITALLNSEIGKALADPAIRKTLIDGAQEPTGGTIESFAQLIRDDYAKYGRLVKDLNVKPQ
jgi:tripartite-type tricarboxylate transporter receptor subunit TctC